MWCLLLLLTGLSTRVVGLLPAVSTTRGLNARRVDSPQRISAHEDDQMDESFFEELDLAYAVAYARLEAGEPFDTTATWTGCSRTTADGPSI